ncbi:hypothetical protein ABC955_01525 [Citromicrobium bathyomarinum]
MEASVLPLMAAVGGFGMTIVMGGKVALDTIRARKNDGDMLSLFIDGKDYSVDLKTIGNGGSEKIHAALTKLECAD